MMSDHRVVIVREMESAPVGLLDDLMVHVEKPKPSTLLIERNQDTARFGGVDRGRRRMPSRRWARFVASRPERGSGSICDGVRAGRMCRTVAQPPSWSARRDRFDGFRRSSQGIAFVGGEGEVGVEDIEAVCSLVAEAAIWDLTDAVVRRDRTEHSPWLTNARYGRASHRLIAMIAWQMRQLITLQDCMRRRVNQRVLGFECRTESGVTSPPFAADPLTELRCSTKSQQQTMT